MPVPDVDITAAIVPEVNTPMVLNTVLPRQAVVSDTTTAEGLTQRPAGLTDPTPVLDQLAPVDASVAGQDVGPGGLRSPLTQSAALPSQLAVVLRAAGYTANNVPTNSAPAARSTPASANGTTESVASPITRATGPTAQQAAPLLAPRTAAALSSPAARPAIVPRETPAAPGAAMSTGRADARSAPATGSGATTQQSPVGPAPYRTGGTAHTAIVQPDLSPASQVALAAAALSAFAPTSATSRVDPRSRNGSAGADRDMVSYSERRPVPIDLAPAVNGAPISRLDDTKTLVTVEADGASAATLRAAALYRSLMVQQAGLSVLRPGEGFTTWDGSPLWLSFAGIRKPPVLGVLTVATPGRVQVMRSADGTWLVEHAGGPWRIPSIHRHDAAAGDDQSLSHDILYGVTTTAALHRFETAITALRFASRIAGPTGARAQEAWAMVARTCALAVAQPPRDAQDRALQASISVVLDGRMAPPASTPPLDRGRFVNLAQSGDPTRIAAGLHGLGQTAMDQIRQGRFDGIGPLEALALAVSLGRLTNNPPPIHAIELWRQR